jgi:hypothetical protein
VVSPVFVFPLLLGKKEASFDKIKPIKLWTNYHPYIISVQQQRTNQKKKQRQKSNITEANVQREN